MPSVTSHENDLFYIQLLGQSEHLALVDYRFPLPDLGLTNSLAFVNFPFSVIQNKNLYMT